MKKLVNNKTGVSKVSERKLASHFNVGQSTICNTLKINGLKYRKRRRAPKITEAQKVRQSERLEILYSGPMNFEDDRDIVMDDKSYLTFSGAGMS